MKFPGEAQACLSPVERSTSVHPTRTKHAAGTASQEKLCFFESIFPILRSSGGGMKKIKENVSQYFLELKKMGTETLIPLIEHGK